ncbi:MAG: hypothetical protein CL843_04750 [Crocinitomicaceae bacterium]|nr:hypothetical protein [Crocinitomicaceae bacterium]
MKNVALFILLFSFGLVSYAQVGGQSTYTFLTMPSSARAASMGGDFISIKDSDLNLVVDNPALLDSNLHNHLTLSYINWLADINIGYGAYARNYKGIGTFSAGLQYINYGTFKQADAAGNITGEFNAGEYAGDISYSRTIDSNWSVGATVKLIYSNMATVNSFGFGFDFGGHYQNNSKNFQAGLVVNNLGMQLKPYYTGNRESLPFEVQLAASQKLPKAPLRFTMLVGNMQQFDLTYDETEDGEPTLNPSGGTNTTEKDGGLTVDNLMRHVVFGAEVLASKNFHIRLSYNYRRRQEMGVAARGGLTGFSVGVGFKIRKFHISWGLSQYHLAGSSNHFTITTNLSEFSRN